MANSLGLKKTISKLLSRVRVHADVIKHTQNNIEIDIHVIKLKNLRKKYKIDRFDFFQNVFKINPEVADRQMGKLKDDLERNRAMKMSEQPVRNMPSSRPPKIVGATKDEATRAQKRTAANRLNEMKAATQNIKNQYDAERKRATMLGATRGTYNQGIQNSIVDEEMAKLSKSRRGSIPSTNST